MIKGKEACVKKTFEVVKGNQLARNLWLLYGGKLRPSRHLGTCSHLDYGQQVPISCIIELWPSFVFMHEPLFAYVEVSVGLISLVNEGTVREEARRQQCLHFEKILFDT